MNHLQMLLSLARDPWAIERGRLQSLMHLLAVGAFNLQADQKLESRLTQKRETELQRAAGAVVVLPIYGMLAQRLSMIEQLFLGGSSVERLQAIFRGLVADDQVKAIVLNFDTPGGATTSIEEFAQEIFDARGSKPIIAQVDSLAASAGYWLASACEEIVLTPSGSVGSVGVYAVHEEMSKLFEQLGVTYTLISSGGLKGANNDFTPLSEELRAELQKRVDIADGMFRKAVARGRGISQSAVSEKFGNGAMFMAAEALANGMVDKVAPLRETLARLGAAPVAQRRGNMLAMRAAAAAGDFSNIAPSVFEDAMREALGLSKSQAAAIAGHGLKILRQGDPGEDRGDPDQADQPSAQELIALLQASARSYQQQP
jgi:signal peptide peptidase SppA